MSNERRGHDDKLALILRSAAAIFADRGFHQASIRDISRATGVSLAGLYHYFRSKEELLFLIQEHCFATVLEKLEQRLAGVTDPELRLRLMIENHLHVFVHNMKEMKVMSHEADSLTGAYRETIDAQKRRYRDIGAGIVRSLRPEGTPADARVATFALFGMMNWIYNWYHPERDVGVTELADRMCQLFLRGYPAGAAPHAGRSSSPDGGPHSIWRH